MKKIENLPKLNEDEIKTISDKITTTFKESLLSDSSTLDDSQKLKDVETVKVIINELLGVKKHLPSTTNLTKNQVHGISKLKTINLIFKSPLIDEYAFNIMELKRSETSEPFSMLKGFFDLANSSQHSQNQDISTIDRILGRKGK